MMFQDEKDHQYQLIGCAEVTVLDKKLQFRNFIYVDLKNFEFLSWENMVPDLKNASSFELLNFNFPPNLHKFFKSIFWNILYKDLDVQDSMEISQYGSNSNNLFQLFSFFNTKSFQIC